MIVCPRQDVGSAMKHVLYVDIPAVRNEPIKQVLQGVFDLEQREVRVLVAHRCGGGDLSVLGPVLDDEAPKVTALQVDEPVLRDAGLQQGPDVAIPYGTAYKPNLVVVGDDALP